MLVDESQKYLLLCQKMACCSVHKPIFCLCPHKENGEGSTKKELERRWREGDILRRKGDTGKKVSSRSCVAEFHGLGVV